MLTLLSEVHFWGTQEEIVLKDCDFSCIKYTTKKDNDNSLTLQSKRTYFEQRGLIWNPINKRPAKLKDKLRELEDHLYLNKVVCSIWEDTKLTLLLSRGILVSIHVNPRTNDIQTIHFDKTLCPKIQNEIICNGLINKGHIICSTTDGRILGHGNSWKEGWTVDGGLRRYLNLHGELLAVWGRSSAEHPQPWSPLAKDHQRANLHLYWVGARGPDLLSYKKTDGEPISVTVSKICLKTLIVVEQKVSQRGSVSIEVSVLELVANTLKRATVTAVPLQTQVCCCTLSENEIRLLLGCIDGTVAILDRNRGSTRTVKASFIPTMAAWNNSGAIATVCNDKGQIQYFDTALNAIKSQMLGTEETANTQFFDLSSYFNMQPLVDSINWDYKDVLIALEHGPLVLITQCDRSLSFLGLINRYLSNGKVSKAINLLLSWDWNEQCFVALQRIVGFLMRQPLVEENAQMLQRALGSFHSPEVPLNVEIRHRYGSQVKAMTRRFFHQLMRYAMYETAFLLAVDLGHHDLFMDLHYVAVKIGETEMAAAARAQASALLSRCSSEASNCSRSSCSQCSDTSTSEGCSSPEHPDLQRTSFNSSNPYTIHSMSDNFLSTNFNTPNPKTFKDAASAFNASNSNSNCLNSSPKVSRGLASAHSTNLGFNSNNSGLYPTNTGFNSTSASLNSTNASFNSTNANFNSTNTGFNLTNAAYKSTNAAFNSTKSSIHSSTFNSVFTSINSCSSGSTNPFSITTPSLSSYVPPIPNVDLPKINFPKPNISTTNYSHKISQGQPTAFRTVSSSGHNSSLPHPPLPITNNSTLPTLNISSELGIPIVSFPSPSVSSYPHLSSNSNRINIFSSSTHTSYTNRNPLSNPNISGLPSVISSSTNSINNNCQLPILEVKTYPTVHSIIPPPPLPITSVAQFRNNNLNPQFLSHSNNQQFLGNMSSQIYNSGLPQGQNVPQVHNTSSLSNNTSMLSHNSSMLNHNNSPLNHNNSTLSHTTSSLLQNSSSLSQNTLSLGHNIASLSQNVSSLGHNVSSVTHNVSSLGQNTSLSGHNSSLLGHNTLSTTQNTSSQIYNIPQFPNNPQLQNNLQLQYNSSQNPFSTNSIPLQISSISASQSIATPSLTTSNNSSPSLKKPQAKVKFSDTVTAFIVPEVKRPVRPPLPAHVTDPQKELADSLPLCHPNEDYLKDFTPIRKTESSETPGQPQKIKVVHFGVV